MELFITRSELSQGSVALMYRSGPDLARFDPSSFGFDPCTGRDGVKRVLDSFLVIF